MNRKSLAAALVLLASAGSVLADDITVENAPFVSGKSRAQVTAEYIRARNEVAATTGEDSGAAWLAQRAPAARAPVLAGRPLNAQ